MNSDLEIQLEQQLLARLLDMTQKGQHLIKLSDLYRIMGYDPPADLTEMDLRIVEYGDNTVGIEDAQNRKNLH